MFAFEVKKELGNARLTFLKTPHGVINGPFFQFVATQASIRGLVYSEDLEKLGVEIVLANTYHLHVRPGEDVIADAGGLHSFMQWEKPITTDSGGYQVFSMGKRLKLDQDGVTFRSPLDGAEHRLTPEKTIQIQQKIGADIIMPLDIATPFQANREDVTRAVTQTQQWAKRCLAEHEKREACQALYGIVQGGLYPDLREQAAYELTDLNFFGYSIGGELRDEHRSRMEEGVAMTVPYLPPDKPRYLMGAGTPADIVSAVRLGIDQFDCVLPIRDARHGRIYRHLNVNELHSCLLDPERPVSPQLLHDVIDIRKSAHTHNMSVFAPNNPAIEKPYTIGYLHHLFRTEPPNGYRLSVLNNIFFYAELMREIRHIINQSGKVPLP